MLSQRNMLNGAAVISLSLFTYYKLYKTQYAIKPKRIAFAVSQSTKEQFKNISDPIISYFKSKGIIADKLSWDDPDANWQDYDLIILYQTWSKQSNLSYYTKKAEYFAWYQRLQTMGKMVVNSFPVIQNYFSKGNYLFNLAAKDINIIPSRLLQQGGNYQLADLITHEGWDQAVLKAAEDDNGLHLFLMTARENPPAQNILSAQQFQAKFAELIKTKSFLLQKFIPEIRITGELSCVYVNNRFNHAVKKQTGNNPHEFRTQRIYSNEAAVPHELHPAQIQAVDRIYQAAFNDFNSFEQPLAARIDVIFDAFNTPMLMEIEAIDPWLYIYEIADKKELMDNFLKHYELALFQKYQLHQERNNYTTRLSSLIHHYPFITAMTMMSFLTAVIAAKEYTHTSVMRP